MFGRTTKTSRQSVGIHIFGLPCILRLFVLPSFACSFLCPKACGGWLLLATAYLMQLAILVDGNHFIHGRDSIFPMDGRVLSQWSHQSQWTSNKTELQLAICLLPIVIQRASSQRKRIRDGVHFLLPTQTPHGCGLERRVPEIASSARQHRYYHCSHDYNDYNHRLCGPQIAFGGCG